MQIVIDIPEEIYSRVELMDNEKLLPYNLRKAYLLIIICAITNGKILPKGHGELIDRKEVMKNMEFEKDGYCDFDCYKPITDAQTIIESDKTESEANNG